MPIATSPQKEQVPVEFQHLLPKPPGYSRRLSPTESVVSDASELVELADLSQQYGKSEGDLYTVWNTTDF